MKHVLSLYGFSLACAYYAWAMGGWNHLFWWVSLSFFIAGSGYAFLGARVFGKNPDGSLSPVNTFLLFPYILLNKALWRPFKWFGQENPHDRVFDDLIVARRLDDNEIPSGLSRYVDLTAEMRDPPKIRKNPIYLCFPILDAGVPEKDELLRLVRSLEPGAVLVHCAYGHGRTGLFALALLLCRGRITTYEQGLKILKNARPGIRLNAAQEAFARDLFQKPDQMG